MDKKFTYPRFITNSPKGEDLFESGAQQRTASSIAQHIDKKVTSYKLIGLDGSWGSGKSNVISIVQKNLGESHHFFIYDAWSHQEDLQRRSFLEEFTDDLQAHGVLEEKVWKVKLHNLLAKKKQTITKTIPKLSLGAIVSLFVIFIIPSLTNLVHAFEQEWVKRIIGILPVVLPIILWIIAICIDKKYMDPTNLLYIYKEKELEQNTEEIVSEKEPSVREFRQWMNELSIDLKKDVVIVFDNMDRLPEEKVQTLWSSIHTFFSESHYPKIWVIVPFDRSQIKEAFQSDYQKSEHFINKTFSVIYSVSPPVLTDWKHFFALKFEEAFGDSNNLEFTFVRNLFDLHNDSITPRGIIAFINDLVALQMIWESSIPLRYMALYVLNKPEILSDPSKVILEKKYLTKASRLFLTDEKVTDYIAALVYNVPLEKAAEVVISRNVVLALRQNDVDQFQVIARHPRFHHLIEGIFAREALDLKATIYILHQLDEEIINKNPKTFQLIWDTIGHRFLESPMEIQKFTEETEYLLIHAGEELREPLCRHIVTSFANSTEFKGSQYYIALSELNDFVERYNYNFSVADLVRIKMVEPLIFLDYLKAAKENFEYFKVIVDYEKLQDYFIKLGPNRLEDGYLLSFLKSHFKFSELEKHISHIVKNGEVTALNLEDVFATYKIVSAGKVLKEKLDDDEIKDLLKSVDENNSGYLELIAMRLERGSDYEYSDDTFLKSFNKDLVVQVAGRIEHYKNYGDLLKQVIDWDKPLFVAVVEELTHKSYGTSTMNILSILQSFSEILEKINVSESQFLHRLNAWSQYIIDKLPPESFGSKLSDIRLFEAAVKTKNTLTEYLLKAAFEYLESIKEEEWSTCLPESESFKWQLLQLLMQNKVITKLNSEIEGAIKSSLKRIATGDIEVPEDAGWNLLYHLVNKRHLKSTVKDIRDEFINKTDIDEERFLFFETMLREQGELLKRSGDVTRKIINPLLEEKKAFSTLLKNAGFYIELIKKAGDDAIDVKEIIKDIIEENPENDALLFFSQAIGVSLKSEELEEPLDDNKKVE